MSRNLNDINENEIRIISKLNGRTSSLRREVPKDANVEEEARIVNEYDSDDYVDFDEIVANRSEAIENNSDIENADIYEMPDVSNSRNDAPDSFNTLIYIEERSVKSRSPRRSKRRRNLTITYGLVLLFIVALIGFFVVMSRFAQSDSAVYEFELDPAQAEIVSQTGTATEGYVEISDTVVDKVPMTIMTPVDAVPVLRVGPETLDDKTAALIIQAADVRADNGDIVGAFVDHGKLLSRGGSKAGFCAIINGKPIIGIADSTPYLEQAIETEGYFFRQYPLVAAGMAVDNKLRLSSFRKALAELDGKTVIIFAQKKLTLNEFSKVLVELGVSNAIYLVGSTTYGYARTKNGDIITFGKKEENPYPNASYMVWQ